MVKITTQKISEKEALKLYSDLITPDITELENTKGKGNNKRHNILDVLKNLKSIFTGLYLLYKDVPLESQESIAERTKLRRQTSDEIANKQKMIHPESFREYFEYLSPSEMYENLNETIEPEKNKAQVNAIRYKLANLREAIKNSPMIDANKTINRNNMQETVERILEFNQLNQSRQGLKILTPNQILSRLPISLAQLKAGNSSENLKKEIRQLLCSLYRSKKLTKQIYKSLIDI